MIEINFETEGWREHLVNNLIWPGLYLIAFALLVKLTIYALTTLHVSGKANEWVVLIDSNGNYKDSGIGLNCFRGPWDQVAKFPSQLNQINFSTQQVDKNMQGVEVSGSIVWSIFRENDGPYKAYKNLGPDLRNKVPSTAN